MSFRCLLLLGALLAMIPHAWAQADKIPNGVFLIAKPAMADPNFRRSVVLVTQAPEGTTVGFIINRPSNRSLAQILPDSEVFMRFTEPVYNGGPVQAEDLFAVFRARDKLQGALGVLDDLSFAMEPAVVEQLMHAPPERVRFFNGYAGWAPGQLAAALAGGGWYVLNADADTVFRRNMDTLWDELIRRVRSVTAMTR